MAGEVGFGGICAAVDSRWALEASPFLALCLVSAVACVGKLLCVPVVV